MTEPADSQEYRHGVFAPSKRTALSGLDGAPPREAARGLAVRLIERPVRGMITFRADLTTAEARSAVAIAMGIDPPDIRRMTASGDHAALWMAPDELLLMTPHAEVGAKTALLSEIMGGRPHLAVDVSDARQIFAIVGRGAREVLAKGAPIDLHPGSFRVNDVRRTRIGQIAAGIVLREAEPETFEVFCFRSYAAHLWAWLERAARAGSLTGVFDVPEPSRPAR